MTKKESLTFLIPLLIILGIITMFFFSKKSKNSSNLDNASTDSTLSVPAVEENTLVEEGTAPVVEGTSDVNPAEVKTAYTVALKTSVGDMKITLNRNQTPKTVENFVTLSKKGFYNNTIFHRVIEGFMIQGGDPQGTGMGGPGYKFDDEPFIGEYIRGAVAMANSGPNTNGSQFFIMHADYPLPKNYVIFGQLVEGFEVLDAIATAPVERSLSGEMSKPKDPVSILSVEVFEE